ncbi:hypothetical protein ATCC90586_009064 [Pythium insidiosum]|nr:hypothetical protein ATCC90586_009064 [Pythium insidiosum]
MKPHQPQGHAPPPRGAPLPHPQPIHHHPRGHPQGPPRGPMEFRPKGGVPPPEFVPVDPSQLNLPPPDAADMPPLPFKPAAGAFPPGQPHARPYTGPVFTPQGGAGMPAGPGGHMPMRGPPHQRMRGPPRGGMAQGQYMPRGMGPRGQPYYQPMQHPGYPMMPPQHAMGPPYMPPPGPHAFGGMQPMMPMGGMPMIPPPVSSSHQPPPQREKKVLLIQDPRTGAVVNVKKKDASADAKAAPTEAAKEEPTPSKSSNQQPPASQPRTTENAKSTSKSGQEAAPVVKAAPGSSSAAAEMLAKPATKKTPDSSSVLSPKPTEKKIVTPVSSPSAAKVSPKKKSKNAAPMADVKPEELPKPEEKTITSAQINSVVETVDGKLTYSLSALLRWIPVKATSNLEAAKKSVQSIMNKMTREKFQKLAKQLTEINMESLEMLQGVIKIIFDKALGEPHFCDMYADLCVHLEQNWGEWSFLKIVQNDDEKNFFWTTMSESDSEVVGPFDSVSEALDSADSDDFEPYPAPEAMKLTEVRIRNGKFVKIWAVDTESSRDVFWSGQHLDDLGSDQVLHGPYASLDLASRYATKECSFKRILLNACQEEFEKDNIYEELEAEHKKAKEEGTLSAESEAEFEEKRIIMKGRMLGNIRFIGELYRKGMLQERIMHGCIMKLMSVRVVEGELAPTHPSDAPDEESIESLCKLLTTMGKDLERHGQKGDAMGSYFAYLEKKLVKDKRLSSRIIFMIRDVIDLRNNRWEPRQILQTAVEANKATQEAMFNLIEKLAIEKNSLSFDGVRRGLEKMIEFGVELLCDVPKMPEHIADVSMAADVVEELIEGGLLIDSWVQKYELGEIVGLEPAFGFIQQWSESKDFDGAVKWIDQNIPGDLRKDPFFMAYVCLFVLLSLKKGVMPSSDESMLLTGFCHDLEGHTRLIAFLIQGRSDDEELKRLLKHLVRDAVPAAAFSRWLELKNDNSVGRKQALEELGDFVEGLSRVK